MWFDAQTANLIGGILGSAAGICGGIFGTIAGLFARKGKHKKFVLIFAIILIVLGAISLCVSIIALLTGQPRHVWYPFMLVGGMLVLLMLPGFFYIKQIYANVNFDKGHNGSNPTHTEA